MVKIAQTIHEVCSKNCIDTGLFYETLDGHTDTINRLRACKADDDARVELLTQQFIDDNF